MLLLAILPTVVSYVCSLPQPHLDRTRLCELSDSELDPKYVSQRDALKQLVLQQAGKKVVGGQELTGKHHLGVQLMYSVTEYSRQCLHVRRGFCMRYRLTFNPGVLVVLVNLPDRHCFSSDVTVQHAWQLLCLMRQSDC